MNYQRVLEFVSLSFEIFPRKLKKFENSLKLPGVVFSISLIIYIGYSDLGGCKTTVCLRTKNREFDKFSKIFFYVLII